MTRSHRNEDRGGEHRWAFNGVEYPTRKLMCEARRAEYVRLLDEEGMNFTQAAHAVGVSKRTGKAWRNGRTRATGRNEKPLVDRYRSTMDKPRTLHPRHLSQEERIQIADRLRLGDSIRAIARLLGRDPGTVGREVERNRNPESGGYEPCRARQKAADRLKRPKPRKAAEGTRLWDEIAAGLRRHWSPEQIADRPRPDFPDNGDTHASVETICQAIYLQARGGLKQEPQRAMRQGRTARRPQGGQGREPRFREPMVMISERPRRSGTGRSRATGRAISSPAAATKAPSARSSSAPPGSRSCCTCPTGTTPNTPGRPSSTRCSTCPNSCATA